MGILKLIASNNFITFNKPLAKIVGVNSAIVFGELCSISSMFDDGEFFYQKERIEEDTCLGSQAVRNALQTLKEIGLISIVKKGIPCKYYYKINEKRLLELLDSDIRCTTSDSTTDTTSGGTSNTTSDHTSSITSDSTTDTTVNNKHNNKTKEYIHNKNISSGDTTTEKKATTEKPYKSVIEHYLSNCKKLYEQKLLNMEKPVISFATVNARLKQIFKVFTPEQVIKGLDVAMNDKWILSNGYPIMCILSDSQINKCVNGKVTEKGWGVSDQISQDTLDNMPF